MLERLTAETFAPLVGDAFRAEVGGGAPFDLVLSACDETRYGSPEERAGAGRAPFSLLFHAADGCHVEQQIVTLRHDGLGQLAIFLVPLGPDAAGMRYEAVFT